MILQTPRLNLRKFKPVDLPSLIDLFADPEVMKYIGPRRAMTAAESREWLLNILDQQAHELTRFAVALQESDELIGVAGLREEDGVKDFGYYFRRSSWGKGYAQEACAAILDYIENTLHITEYQVFIADENIHSIRMIERVGLQAGEAIIKSGEHGHLYQRNF